MKKIILGLVAATAVVAPTATATAANAATTGSGTMNYVTTYQGVQYPHASTTTYTCNDGSIGFTFVGETDENTGNGSGTIVGSTFEYTGHRVWDDYTYTGSGHINPDGSFLIDAAHDSMGQVTATAEGSLTGIPNCAVDAVVPVGNHGQFVSGATHDGVKGKALADIAKRVELVGPYNKNLV